MKRHGDAGFSLLELLVVIAIIALLAAMFFPVLSTVRKRSHSVTCLSNLRQIGIATAAYAADYNDLLPWAPSPSNKKLVMDGSEIFGSPLDDETRLLPDIRFALHRYGATKEVFLCPSDSINAIIRAEGGHAETWYEECGSSYYYDDHHALLGRSLSGYPNSSGNVLASDMGSFHGGDVGPAALINVLFADMHAKTVTSKTRAEALASDPFKS
jgi:prepilin-type N-terminal cleavage/methylation domain-containing protein